MGLRVTKVTRKNEKDATLFADREWSKWIKAKGYDHDIEKHAFVAYKDNDIVGYASMKISGGAAYLSQLIVLDEARGNGVGTLLIKEFEACAMHNKCHVAYLETHERNVEALSLYKNNGYSVVAKLKNNRFHFTWYFLSKRISSNAI